MPRMRRLTFSSVKFLVFVPTACALITGCATSAERKDRSTPERFAQKSPNQRVFAFPYESVWRATQLALKYPIAVNNMDNGLLETDWIKAADGFISPTATKEPSAGIRYKLSLALTKGKLDGRESVRITIIKKIEKQRDFFSAAETLSTDGLEEKVLFYRIERELLVEEGLKKAAKMQKP